MSAFVVVVLLASADTGQGSISDEHPRLPELNWIPRSDCRFPPRILRRSAGLGTR
jgi:hypothetical protein